MEHLQSTTHCQLLRCALEVIDCTKSADAVRIITVPIVCAAAASGDDKPTSSPTTKTNSYRCQNELQDRVQRRKEKKRRKIELRKQQQEESTLHSEVVTTTSFCNFGANTTSSVLHLSVRAIIYVKPLIILDVNGILCHRLRQNPQVLQFSPESYRKTKKTIVFRPSVGHVANTDIVPRSDLHQFLTLLNNNFSLAVCKYFAFFNNECISILYLYAHMIFKCTFIRDKRNKKDSQEAGAVTLPERN
jgi:hypothetical protein